MRSIDLPVLDRHGLSQDLSKFLGNGHSAHNFNTKREARFLPEYEA